ncbi:MAG TPA: hypothetical protein VIN40_06560 [Candidatus Tyrphobacter sp.]
MTSKRLVALACAASLAACASTQAKATAQADAVTRAVYADDVADVTSRLDPGVAAVVTRGEVGTLSDKMHALGTYHGLQSIAGTMPANEFTYQAVFDKGTMIVVVRIDPNGKLGAYRVVPQRR